jgi:PTH1 family peptidyl-tRNA hydrolase
LRLFGRRRGGEEAISERILVVGLGNPGRRYTGTRHNVGIEVAAELSRRWDLPRPKERYKGLLTEGRIRPGGPQVAILVPRTYMNESGDSVGPARGQFRVPVPRIVVIHDEIDFPFGEVQSKQGGGVGGHNGLKSVAQGVGERDFWRVRVGVGRPETTDSDIVSAYVLGRFSEPEDQVRELIFLGSQETERVVERIWGQG